jgi:hypothetical protein
MDAAQKGKLERYFRNSQRFLWGLGKGKNQESIYKWLSQRGLSFTKGSYDHVIRQLLENPGIEPLLRDVIIPQVTHGFTDKALDYLRACWLAGTTPDLALLKSYEVLNASPFLEINTQFKYVERWGEFAGLWFEEIEKLQESTGDDGQRERQR